MYIYIYYRYCTNIYIYTVYIYMYTVYIYIFNCIYIYTHLEWDYIGF